MNRFTQFLKSLFSPSVSESSDNEMDDNTPPVVQPLREGKTRKGGRNDKPKNPRPDVTPSGQNPKKRNKSKNKD